MFTWTDHILHIAIICMWLQARVRNALYIQTVLTLGRTEDILRASFQLFVYSLVLDECWAGWKRLLLHRPSHIWSSALWQSNGRFHAVTGPGGNRNMLYWKVKFIVHLTNSSRSYTVHIFSTRGHHSSYVSIQRFKLNLCAKLEYRIKHLRIKYCFHPTSQREQNRHFLVNCGTKYH